MNTISTHKQKTRTSIKSLLAFIGLLFISATAIGQVTYTDSVCAGSQDVVYGVTGPVASSTYNWWLSNPGAGTIDNSITGNNNQIEIDWGIITGTYTLYVQETSSNGCLGDTVSLNVIINPLPTVAIVADSVCEGFAATLTLTLTGQAPWTVDYTDGTNNYTTVANSSPHTVTLPAYTTSQTITITGVTDGNTCDADAAGLPSTGVVVFPKPTTGAIFHY